MALTNGANLGLLVNGDAGEEHYDELMAQWRGIDGLVQARVLDRHLTAPPGSPATGDCYIVAGSATGAWASHDNKITRYSGTAWEFYTPKSGWRVYVVDEARNFTYSGSAWGRSDPVQVIPIAVGDETTAITAGTAKVTFHMPFDFDLTEVIGELATVQTSGSIFTMDVNEAGVSILSTKITIDNTEETSLTGTAPVLSDTHLAKGAKITIDVDQVGDGTAKGAKVHLVGRPT